MCGIVGLFSSVGVPASGEQAEAMLGFLRHRGPDAFGIFHDERVGLGSARLRIQDLIGGDQPLNTPDERYWIVYNGEVYNFVELRTELEALGHVFLTASDSEVVLFAWAEWGYDAFEKLNGAFAFAIYDQDDGRLILCRDRYGKRPLYYMEHDGGLYFASELKSFLAVPGYTFAWDPAALAAVLAAWTPFGDKVPFAGIRQVEEGQYLEVSAGGVTRHVYASLKLNHEPFEGTREDAVAALDTSLRRSVKLRLRSDVEVGTYLSGGLDSAVTTALAKEYSQHPVRTFSVAFENEEFDESVYQQELAETLGTKHTSLRISDNDIAENLPEALWHGEMPVFRTAFVPLFLLSRKVNEAGIRVVLTGEGADEALLGYNLFKETQLRLEWGDLSGEARLERVSKLYPYLKHFGGRNAEALVALFERLGGEVTSPLFSHDLRFQNNVFSLRLLQPEHRRTNLLADHIAAQPAGMTDWPPLVRAQWLEFRTLLSGYLLSTQGDRMTLAHSVENRCPFLDKEFVQLTASLNHRFYDADNEKSLLKDAYRDVLPPKILQRSKQPYRAPEATSIVKANPGYLSELFSEDTLGRIGCLEPKFCQALFQKVQRGASAGTVSPRENHAFVFLISILWLDRFFVQRQFPEFKIPKPSVTRRIAGRRHSTLETQV
ncbi:asparagine synthase (glutamine-hydrolyzing) [Akkermansiaceae bacterium]|nr:asparagine synthase (glutamine-hydrolyzing) [Akkermansiaceae bacterium]